MKNQTEERTVRVFACGKQMRMWDINCEECKKYDVSTEPPTSRCEIWDELQFAMLEDGKIRASIATRMGFDDQESWTQGKLICPEREV